MVVVSLTDCPPKIRGDLTKWLCEINTGVYVGNLSARVRDELWGRICENLSHGKATMVYSAPNEQGMEFRVHNTTWQIVDFDGIKLMLRPEINLKQPHSGLTSNNGLGFSKAARFLRASRFQKARLRAAIANNEFVAASLVCSGLVPGKDEISEIAALHVVNNEVSRQFSAFIINNNQKQNDFSANASNIEPMSLTQGLEAFEGFIENKRLILYNAPLFKAFLRAACQKADLPEITNECTDTLTMAKRSLDSLEEYSLPTIAKHFNKEIAPSFTGLDYCKLIFYIYTQLSKM